MFRIWLLHIVIFLSCETFAASMWMQRADFPTVGRHRATSITIANKGYMGLGHYNGAGPNIVKKDWWEYDPGTNSWAQKADYIGGSASGTYAALSFGIGNYGYVGGGQVAPNANFYRYDPSTNSWTQMASSPTLPMNTQGFSIGDKGYYISGNQLYEYNATVNQWTTKNVAPFTVSVWNSTFVIDNKGYVKSGMGLWEYKPTTDSWISRAVFPGLATAGSVAFSQNNKGYIATGYAGWLSEVVSEVWEFDPSSNVWTQLEDFPGTNRRFGNALQIGNRCYLGIGTNGTNFSDFWEFDKLASLKEQFNDHNFSCYPNPASDVINFQTKEGTEFSLIVSNAMGRIVLEEKSSGGKIQLQHGDLPNGIYFYQIQVGSAIVRTDKFIFI